MECSVDSCHAKAVARGWCPKHWYRWRTHGDATYETPQDLSTEDRFWRKVDRKTPQECWLWTAGRRGDGYGAFQVEADRQIGAHRFSFEIQNGPIPDGMVVMHDCDTPLCVNPSHLRLGTNADNQADSVAKGRRNPGSQNHNAKLNERQVRAIRRNYAMGGVSQKQLADWYDVSPALISFIITRRAWKHI